MFIPLYDYNPLRTITRPYVSRGLIVANVLIFVLFQSGYVVPAEQASTFGFGMIPAVISQVAVLPEQFVYIPEPLTLVTYMFVHGGWLHLAGNMLFLWVFGDNVEDAMGHVRFAVFYLACGIAAGLAHAVAVPDSEAPLVGASGAIAGVIAAYLMLHPRVKLWVLVLGRIPLRISAQWVLGLWIAFQIVNLFVSTDDGTAWWAHVGGFAAGAVLVLVMRRPGVPLFDKGLPA
jgi:membrane associated rhomboid family serine protease